MDIKTPLTAAMKRRAVAALEAMALAAPVFPASEALAGEEVRDKSTQHTPRQMRSFILGVDDSDAVRASMKAEGWFDLSDGPDFRPESNVAVRLS